MPNSYTISVTIGPDSIQVDPDELSMTSADDLCWKGTNARPFSIVFDNDGVFGRRELDHAAATTKQRARSRGRFKYSVVSVENPRVMLDPVIVVGDPPTGEP